MTLHTSTTWRAGLALLVGLAELSHLAWDDTHGGIPSHHLLNRADLPAVSNAWGALLLPLLAWWLIGRIQQRLARARAHGVGLKRARLEVALGFSAAALVGITIAVAFSMNVEAVSSAAFLGTLLAALVLPLYRAEFVLGFVLAMAYTFGPVLPIGVAGVIAAISYVSTVLVFGAISRWLLPRLRRTAPARPA